MDTIKTGQAIVEKYQLAPGLNSMSLLAILDAIPGSVPKPMYPPRASQPNVLVYKVMGKIFAILSVRGTEGVIIKCDPEQVSFLRDQYEGVGHRSHLDPRHWISIRLGSDVPFEEIEPLILASYRLVCSSLTKKQQAELASLPKGGIASN